MFGVHILHGNISSQSPSPLTILAENKRNYKNRPTLDGRQLDLAHQRSLPSYALAETQEPVRTRGDACLSSSMENGE